MATSEAQKKASIRWQATHYRRIPLDVYPDEHERLKKISAAAGQSLNGWIKSAIREKIEREGISRTAAGAVRASEASEASAAQQPEQ